LLDYIFIAIFNTLSVLVPLILFMIIDQFLYICFMFVAHFFIEWSWFIILAVLCFSVSHD